MVTPNSKTNHRNQKTILIRRPTVPTAHTAQSNRTDHPISARHRCLVLPTASSLVRAFRAVGTETSRNPTQWVENHWAFGDLVQTGLVSDPSWVPSDFATEAAWLGGIESGDAWTGFDAAGWDASVWIAHAMWEIPDLPDSYTHDDVYRAQIAAGLEEPLVLPGLEHLDLDALTTVTGTSSGMLGRPSSDCKRLRWNELAQRLGEGFDDQTVPPCFRWFSYSSWPASIQPPPEGSLDELSVRCLVPHLLAATPHEICVATYAHLAAGWGDDRWHCYRGPISGLEELVDADDGRVGLPSNVWPPDFSWFVYTDYDLWGTKVSGPKSLIDGLRADSNLETIDWTPPQPASSSH